MKKQVVDMHDPPQTSWAASPKRPLPPRIGHRSRRMKQRSRGSGRRSATSTTWSVRFAGPAGSLVSLNEEPVEGGEVTGFEVFPDSAGTIYLSDQDVDGRFRLYVADSRLFGDGFEDGTTNAWPDTP